MPISSLRPSELVAVTLACTAMACGEPGPEGDPYDPTQPSGGVPSTGGAGATGASTTGGLGLGGSATGGLATGGVGLGGIATGGVDSTGGLTTGGQSVGGGPTGGIATGGAAAGGLPTGGAATGGSPTGGVSSGGTPSGGVATGGAGTGGDGSNGAATGGAPNGGTETGGTNGDCPRPNPGTSGQNPLIPELYTADPAALVHNCTFYITAGHDEGSTGFFLRDWYVLSSTDMVNWTDNGGPVLGLDTFSWSNANAWASQMVEKDGRFYWYVPIAENSGAMAIGVAVANSPLGPFTDAIGGPLVNDQIEMQAFGYSDPAETVYTIDPSVYVDDDGQAYLVYGSFFRMVSVRLGSDMISLQGDMVESTPRNFFEAPYLIQYKGTWYVVYAAGANPASIDFATSDSPFGPWQYRGTILEPLPNNPGEDAATSHPAIQEFAGQWYLVYHLSNGPGGGTYRRQVAIDKLYFNDDGTIQPVTPTSGLTF